MMRVVIFGGSGVFGGRLAQILSRDARFELLIAGRDAAKAERCAAALEGPARSSGAGFDISDIDHALKKYAPDLAVHCAGPFQGQDYTVAKAAIAARIPYIDLSDGRAFSQGFEDLDAAAKEADVFALTACSTTTALSTAAAMRLAEGFNTVDGVRVGITPGNRAPRGRAVVEAILSYVGEPIPTWRNGGPDTVTGWGMLAREKLPRLNTRWFSPCDAPDLLAMRRLFPAARDIEFLAGLELPVLHLPLWGMAKLRRNHLLPNLARASGVFHRAASLFEPFGSDEGGMFVELVGTGRNNDTIRRRWSLWAGSGDGPFIPAMAAAAIARGMASGDVPPPGARITAGDISLNAFEAEFSAYNIRTQIEERDDGNDVSTPAWRAL